MVNKAERATDSDTRSTSERRRSGTGASSDSKTSPRAAAEARPAATNPKGSSASGSSASAAPSSPSNPAAQPSNPSNPAQYSSPSATPPPVAAPQKNNGAATIPPASLDALTERYAAVSGDPNTFSAEEAIDQQIAALESWSKANIWRERRDLLRFWFLRGIAFAGAITAGMAGFLPHASPLLGLGAGSAAVVALAVDSAWPPSSDRVTRRRATRELRELQHTLQLKWDKVRLAHPEKYSPKRIAHALALLDFAQSKREEIGGYLTDSSPGVSGKVTR